MILPFAALLVGFCAWLGPRLADGLWEPHEAQAVLAARQPTSPPGMPIGFGVQAATFAGSLSTSDPVLRLPNAVLALLILGGVVALGGALAGARAAALAGFVLLTSPAFFFQTLHVTSEIAVWCAALGVLGGAYLCLERQGAARAVGGALVLLAALLATAANSTMQGFWLPALAVGAACATGGARERRLLGTALIGLVGLAVLLGFFDWRPGYPGEWALFGWRPSIARDPSPWFPLTYDSAPNPESTFEHLFESIVFGMFPWSVLMPIAAVRLIRRAGSITESALLFLVFGSYAVATGFDRHATGAAFMAQPAVAIAIGGWLADAWSERERPELPVLGLFLLLSATVIGRDLADAPGELPALSLVGATYALGEAPRHSKLLALFGATFGLALFWYATVPGALPRPFGWLDRLRRRAPSSLVIALCIAGLSMSYISWVFTPRVTRTLSKKHVFAGYRARERGEPLFVGDFGQARELYAPPGAQPMNRNAMLASFAAPARSFGLVRAPDLCVLHNGAATARAELHVLEATDDVYLISNRLDPGEPDRNPLLKAIRPTEPQDIGHHTSAVFQERIELLGASMPQRVEKNKPFEVVLDFKVLDTVAGTWKVFAHFDQGRSRFQGDHDPLADLSCATLNWKPGMFVRDRFKVTAGAQPGRYDLWVGFYRGTDGNYQNMDVTAGNHDEKNRVHVGSLEVH